MATVTATLKKNKDTEYKAELEIKNTSGVEVSNWNITVEVSSTSTISDVNNFTISKKDDTTLLLTPADKISVLKPGKNLSEKFTGTGTMPTKFTFNTPNPGPGPGPVPPTPGGSVPPSPAPPTIPAGATVVYNIQMNKFKDISELSALGCKYQYSYPENSGYTATNPNPKYFALTGTSGLAVNIYAGDKPFQSGSNTEPRSELRFMAPITDNRNYVYQWDQYMVPTPTFDYAWSQVFGSDGPAFIIRYRSGGFQLLQDQGSKQILKFTDTSITPQSDTGVWVNWRFEFNSSNSGYERLYRNGVLMCEATSAKNSIGTNAYLKNGIYAQQVQPSNDVTLYKDNIICYYT